MMSREELLLRSGFYFARAARELGDSSYARKYLGHAELLNEADAVLMFAEIHGRLVAAGKCAPDHDPFDELGFSFPL
jgi:hypothetical protein